jgi:hypothetical protein
VLSRRYPKTACEAQPAKNGRHQLSKMCLLKAGLDARPALSNGSNRGKLSLNSKPNGRPVHFGVGNYSWVLQALSAPRSHLIEMWFGHGCRSYAEPSALGGG